VSQGAEVSRPAVEAVTHRQPVVKVLRIEELPATADVEDDRQLRLLCHRPHGEQAGVAGRVSTRTGRRYEQGLATRLHTLFGHPARQLEVGERHVADRE